MTRETKIGLLVGLAFIIVIGILLSDHFRGTMEPPPAMLDRAGATVRQAVNAPGSSQAAPPVTMPPSEVSPRGPVQTPNDLQPRYSPVVPVSGEGQRVGRSPVAIQSINTPASDDSQTSRLAGPSALAATALQHGEQLVAVDPAGQAMLPRLTSPPARSYRAGSGDTVSRMASKFLGGNTKQNRDAIVRANPSLRDNPNKVIVGQSYTIPSPASAPISALDRQAMAPAPPAPRGASPTADGDAAAADWVYVVKPGDTIWRIANDQLSDTDAIDAIKELNRGLLHGNDTLRVGMKLRLPARPVASAN